MGAQIAKLGPADVDALRSLLISEPVENLHLLCHLEELGITPKGEGNPAFAFYGLLEEGRLSAAAFAGRGGLVIPAARRSAQVQVLAARLTYEVKLTSSIGERSSVEAVTRSLCKEKLRLSRPHRLLAVSADGLGPFVTPALRLARESDLDGIVPLGAGAIIEMLERDPMLEPEDAFKKRVLRRIRAQRTYVLELEGRLVSKIDVKGRSQYGAELDGVYTAPEHRLLGYATLALGQLSRHLLSAIPRLTLRVDESSQALMTVARKVGYADGQAEQLLVVK